MNKHQKALDRINWLSVKVGLHCLDTDDCHCPDCKRQRERKAMYEVTKQAFKRDD